MLRLWGKGRGRRLLPKLECGKWKKRIGIFGDRGNEDGERGRRWISLIF